ncbi:MAG: hypothetical protein ACRDUA_09685 [Micromonosporaceae bacterium]
MSATAPILARRYRRLLLCYPRSYRRERGHELVDTMLAVAPADRTRPTPREAANLICHGLRSRLGRPASRTVVAFATLTAVVCGLFTAALATRAAWETARPLPGAAEAATVFDAVLPGHELPRPRTDPALFVIFAEPLSLQNVDELFIGEGGEYQAGYTGSSVAGALSPADQKRTLRLARERLRATGWTVEEPVTDGRGDTLLLAQRGDTTIHIELYSDADAESTYLAASLYRATPAAVYPAGMAGGLLGALFGWLLFGWASRRTENRHAAVRMITVILHGITLTAWYGPLLGAPWLLHHHLDEPHLPWSPFWEWLGQPGLFPFLALGTVVALLGLAIAALPQRSSDQAPTTATG